MPPLRGLCHRGQVGQFRVWDTELRNGVLIYVLVADRDVEILADRGAAALIPAAGWEVAAVAGGFRLPPESVTRWVAASYITSEISPAPSNSL